MRRFFAAFNVLLRRSVVLLLLALLLDREMAPSNDLNFEVGARVGNLQFDFTGWTLNALGLKVAQSASGEQSYLGTGDRKQIVLDYFGLLDHSLDLERQIDQIFADPNEIDPRSEEHT